MKNTIVLQGDKLYNHEKDGFEVIEYPTRYEEFTCKRVEIKQPNKETCDLVYSYPSIGLVLKGKGLLSVKNEEDKDYITHEFKEGESFLFLPDSVIKITSSQEGEVSVCLTTSQSL
jgi:mannose-6-phosphate isomerase class I